MVSIKLVELYINCRHSSWLFSHVYNDIPQCQVYNFLPVVLVQIYTVAVAAACIGVRLQLLRTNRMPVIRRDDHMNLLIVNLTPQN